jgi:hypothetical protein
MHGQLVFEHTIAFVDDVTKDAYHKLCIDTHAQQSLVFANSNNALMNGFAQRTHHAQRHHMKEHGTVLERLQTTLHEQWSAEIVAPVTLQPIEAQLKSLLVLRIDDDIVNTASIAQCFAQNLAQVRHLGVQCIVQLLRCLEKRRYHAVAMNTIFLCPLVHV